MPVGTCVRVEYADPAWDAQNQALVERAREALIIVRGGADAERKVEVAFGAVRAAMLPTPPCERARAARWRASTASRRRRFFFRTRLWTSVSRPSTTGFVGAGLRGPRGGSPR